MKISEKFKTILNKETDKKEKVAGDILKHLLQNKSMQLLLIVVYDFETMTVETDDPSKPEELRKNKSSTIKTSEHITIWFALAIY